MFLSVSRHVSSSKDRGSLVIIEAIVLVPIIVGIVGLHRPIYRFLSGCAALDPSHDRDVWPTLPPLILRRAHHDIAGDGGNLWQSTKDFGVEMLVGRQVFRLDSQ